MQTIDEEVRKKFEADWLNGHSLSIRDYLPGDSTETYIGTLEELVCIDMEFRWRPEGDHNSKSNKTVSIAQASVQTRVEDYIREFPELNQAEIVERLVEQEILVRVSAGYIVEPSEYRSRFPTVKIDESLFSEAVGEATNVSQVRASSTELSFPCQFGEYVLTGQLGRGGMGAVYRARQPAAGREVAIKIAEVGSISPSNRIQLLQRFETEAHTAASIVHDHVVPIYDVGKVDDRPFIAMRLVEGGDLGGKSKGEPLPPRVAAKYLLEVSKAIAHAHAGGMLHRDIKPQNILVDQDSDRAMLTDFGLARYIEDDSGVTQSGQLLGTPSFMPPEQIRDSSGVDERADVYSIGATGYQLLTGRPPFKASDMHETLKQVIAKDPISAKLVNAEIDRDLDTICLKCLEKEPESRYQTAADLASDLDAYLEGRPIAARPAGPIRRLTKWCKRNRALATAQGLAIAGVLAALITSAVGWSLTSKAWKGEAIKKKLANDVKNVILPGWRRQFSNVRDEPLLNLPGMEATKRRFYEDAFKQFEQLIPKFEQDAEMAPDRAYALAALADISLDMNMPIADSHAKLLAAKQAFSEIENDFEERADLLEAYSNVEVGLGKLALREKQLSESYEHFEAAKELRIKWVARDNDNLESHRKLANAMMNEGVVLRAQAEAAAMIPDLETSETLMASAEKRFVDAQEIRSRYMEKGDHKLRRDFGKAEFNLAFLYLRKGELKEALRLLGSAEETIGSLAEEIMSDSNLWEDFAKTRINRVECLSMLPEFLEDETLQGEALTTLDEALSDLEALMRIKAQNEGYRFELASQYQQGIDALIMMRGFGLAEDHVNRLGLLLEDTISSAVDHLHEEVPRSWVVVQLHHLKHLALLAAAFDFPKDASETVQKVICEFEEHPDVVMTDRILAQELKALQSLKAKLIDELDKPEKEAAGDGVDT